MITAQQHLDQAIQYGNAIKPDSRKGKEYYALWVGGSDPSSAILEFFYQKAIQFYPTLKPRVNAVGIYWHLMLRNRRRMDDHDQAHAMLYIHKRKFRKYLKDAIIHG